MYKNPRHFVFWFCFVLSLSWTPLSSAYPVTRVSLLFRDIVQNVGCSFFSLLSHVFSVFFFAVIVFIFCDTSRRSCDHVLGIVFSVSCLSLFFPLRACVLQCLLCNPLSGSGSQWHQLKKKKMFVKHAETVTVCWSVMTCVRVPSCRPPATVMYWSVGAGKLSLRPLRICTRCRYI